MARRPLTKFWVLVLPFAAEDDEETIREEWPSAEPTEAITARWAAEEAAKDAIDSDDEEVVVIVAMSKEGDNAEKYTVTRETCYHVSAPDKVDVKPLPVNDDGEVIKGTQDDQTLNLFASA